ncbi:MAG: crystallin J1 [Chloroflexi bacterium]|nr:crystallin J1 [Chloroflexota bacterium]
MSHTKRLERARVALEGLSVADAFGAIYEGRDPVFWLRVLETRELPATPWLFTDDTNMALSIFSVLRQFGAINQDALAADFAARYDSRRGYGAAMHGLLARYRRGEDWRAAAGGLFNGTGSYGNGSAMRVGLVGAYFADDLDAAVEAARLSAEVTHAHPEAEAGAIAVAVAAAVAWNVRQAGERPARADFIARVVLHVPESEVRAGLVQARDLRPDATAYEAITTLGNGSRVTCMDTVPFALWCAGEQLDDYEEAFWLTLSGGGDTDTTCAIVGGIVASYTGVAGIPAAWLEAREPLSLWAFGDEEG